MLKFFSRSSSKTWQQSVVSIYGPSGRGPDALPTVPLCWFCSYSLKDIVNRLLIRRRSFPVCWRSANNAPISHGAPSPENNYHLISTHPFCPRCLRSLFGFCEKFGLFPVACFATGKVRAVLMHAFYLFLITYIGLWMLGEVLCRPLYCNIRLG